MGAKQSPEMAEAQRLVTKCGFTQYAAAVATGVTRGGISKAPWYREHLAKQAEAEKKRVAKNKAQKARDAARRKGAKS